MREIFPVQERTSSHIISVAKHCSSLARADVLMGLHCRHKGGSQGAGWDGPSVLASGKGMGPERCSLADGRAQFHRCERGRLQAAHAGSNPLTVGG